MVFVIPEQRASPYGEAIGRGLGEGFFGSLERRSSQRRLQNILGGEGDVQDKMTAILSSNINPEDRQSAIQLLQFQEKQRLEQQRQRQKQEILSQVFGRSPDETLSVEQSQQYETPSVGQPQQLIPASTQLPVSRQPTGQQFTDEQILAISTVDPNLAKLIESRKTAQQRTFEARAKRDAPIVQDFFKKTNELVSGLTQKEVSLELMVDSIKSGNIGGINRDFLAEITGFEPLRTAKGAQFISSGKEFFLGSLRRAGPRPNQWIEQQIQKMLPKIGRSEEANLTVAETLRTSNAIERRRVELVDEVADELEKTKGFVTRKLPFEVEKRLKKFAKREQKDLEHRLRDVSGDFKRGKVPPGFQLSRKKAAWYLKMAKGNKQKARAFAEKDGHNIPKR